MGLEPKSTEPKTQKEETPIWIKERIIEIRKKTKKCALKIHWQPKKEGISIHPRTIGKILKKEKLVRKYHVRKGKYKYIRAERKSGELVEIDVKYVPGRIANKRYFQYTATDTASRWRYLNVYGVKNQIVHTLGIKPRLRYASDNLTDVRCPSDYLFLHYYCTDCDCHTLIS